ncbi:MAG: NAD(P)H-binding protein [Minwuia sp.]|uniref:NAD(P)H-binding protein n=1 Tax=Minwuia sp. TaxID=2493630 RepID=UPI003A865473
MTNRILIIGVTGGAGHAVSKAALDAGFQVRALHRNPGKLEVDSRIEVVQGDAMNAIDVRRAAEGVDFVFHAANPPGYRDWDRTVEPMAVNAAEAAKAVDARMIMPGNIYNFGPDVFPRVEEGAPQHPVSRKGEVRVRVEAALKATGARVTILRAGDFFGGYAPASWFQTVMIKPGKKLRKVTWPGTEAGHAFAYLPDFAATVIRLFEGEARMERFEDLHFGGHHMHRGREFPERIAEAAGLKPTAVRPFPWAVVGLARPFVPLFREIWEMRYLWQQEVQLDNRRLLLRIGEEPRTPLAEALRTSLVEQGCVSETATWTGGHATLFSG